MEPKKSDQPIDLDSGGIEINGAPDPVVAKPDSTGNPDIVIKTEDEGSGYFDLTELFNTPSEPAIAHTMPQATPAPKPAVPAVGGFGDLEIVKDPPKGSDDFEIRSANKMSDAGWKTKKAQPSTGKILSISLLTLIAVAVLLWVLIGLNRTQGEPTEAPPSEAPIIAQPAPAAGATTTPQTPTTPVPTTPRGPSEQPGDTSNEGE